jgi:serine protease Do
MLPTLRSFARRLGTLALALGSAASWAAAASAPAAPPPALAASAAGPDTVSVSASRAYERARSQLVQIRTVLKGRDSQTSVGSGFFVSAAGHIVTNFHVVSEAALSPDQHDLLYVTADGREARLVLLMIDVRHDLALLKAADQPPQPFEALGFRPASEPLRQGERMVSLGNPLDVGFAIVEGLYNGLVERSFYPQIFFAGSLSAGMSGGPALDQQGRVVGVNVARRGDGEQISFLVPAAFARELVTRGQQARPMVGSAYPEMARQLMVHQEELTQRFIDQGWKRGTHPRYSVPVPADRFMRCWGATEPSSTGGVDIERSECAMDSEVFAGGFSTGSLSTRHEAYTAPRLGRWRFAAAHASSFANESFTRLTDAQMTQPQCHEDFLDNQGLALRAVVCLRAYRKLPQLYDVSVLVATLDQPTAGVQGRFDGEGLSYDNAMKLTRHYLAAFGRLP